MNKFNKKSDLLIKIDRDACVSCGSCAAIAPQMFELDGDMKSSIREDTAIDAKKAVEAAKSCPAGVITIIDGATNEKLWPE